MKKWKRKKKRILEARARDSNSTDLQGEISEKLIVFQ